MGIPVTKTITKKRRAKSAKRRSRKKVTRRLIYAAKEGHQGAVEEVLNRCDYIVRHIAAGNLNSGGSGQGWAPVRVHEYEARLAVAREAIWKDAIPRYDPEHISKTAFTTYAFWWAKKAVSLLLRTTRTRRKYLATQTEIEPGWAADAVPVGVQGMDVFRTPAQVRRESDHDQDEMVRKLDFKAIQGRLFEALRTLPAEQQIVVFHRFWKEDTLREVQRLSRECPWIGLTPMSRQRVLNIQNAALSALREALADSLCAESGKENDKWESETSPQQEDERRKRRRGSESQSSSRRLQAPKKSNRELLTLVSGQTIEISTRSFSQLLKSSRRSTTD